jgi:hypothetical protein
MEEMRNRVRVTDQRNDSDFPTIAGIGVHQTTFATSIRHCNRGHQQGDCRHLTFDITGNTIQHMNSATKLLDAMTRNPLD